MGCSRFIYHLRNKARANNPSRFPSGYTKVRQVRMPDWIWKLEIKHVPVNGGRDAG